MSKIVNLTQHAATPSQIEEGVFDLPDAKRAVLIKLLTFDALPTEREILERAAAITDIAIAVGASNAILGGALWLMAPLADALRNECIIPYFSFSERKVTETVLPDGTTKKISEFSHAGFVPAI
jgi:hypothetical protein